MSAPRRVDPSEPLDWGGLLALIRDAFAGHEGRIDPPSSAGRLTSAALARHARDGEVWILGEPPEAVVLLTPLPGRLRLGKLAVRRDRRGRGHARALMGAAQARARALGLPALELQTRIELAENHAAFAAMGFERAGTTTHEGFRRPTSVTFRKAVG